MFERTHRNQFILPTAFFVRCYESILLANGVFIKLNCCNCAILRCMMFNFERYLLMLFFF